MTLHPTLHHLIHDVLCKSPFAGPLGIAVETAEPERVVLRLPFRPGLATVGTIVHGGAISTLIDVCGAAASASAADPEKTRGGATVNLVTAFLAPADGCDLIAEARVLQRSSSQTVSDVVVRDPAGTLVAKGLVTSRIFTAR